MIRQKLKGQDEDVPMSDLKVVPASFYYDSPGPPPHTHLWTNTGESDVIISTVKEFAICTC